MLRIAPRYARYLPSFGRCRYTSKLLLLCLFTFIILGSIKVNRTVHQNTQAPDGPVGGVITTPAQAVPATDSVTIMPVTTPAAVVHQVPSTTARIEPMNHTECEVSCPAGKFSFVVKSGHKTAKTTTLPQICWMGQEVVKPEELSRGINMVVIGKESEWTKLKNKFTFDTYEVRGERDLQNIFFTKIDVGDVVLLATHDDAANNLALGRLLFEFVGSSFVRNLAFRDTWVLVGQKGLAVGEAREAHSKTGKDPFASTSSISGCVSLPMTEKYEVLPSITDHLEKVAIQNHKPNINCGLPKVCPANMYSLSLHTGTRSMGDPKICVDHSFYVHKELPDGAMTQEGDRNTGRGFNFVQFRPATAQVIRVAHFDTFKDDSRRLEMFLLTIPAGDHLIGLTHDDASTKLSKTARAMLSEFGSWEAFHITFRAVWVFVGERGRIGFSIYENVHYPKAGEYADPIEMNICVPHVLVFDRIHRDNPDEFINKDRLQFCSKYADGYGDFCAKSIVVDHLVPPGLPNAWHTVRDIQDVPISVIAGFSFNNLRMTLETIVGQTGLKVDLVTVFPLALGDEASATEVKLLVELFKFKLGPTVSAETYETVLATVLAASNKDVMILIEPDVLLAPDFFTYQSQMLAHVKAGISVVASTAWNPNSFANVSSDETKVYLTREAPGYGTMWNVAFLKSHILTENSTLRPCCTARPWKGWSLPADKYMIMPDMSLVFHLPIATTVDTASSHDIRALYHRDRATNLKINVLYTGAVSSIDSYRVDVEHSVQRAEQVDTVNMRDCYSGTGIGFYLPNGYSQMYAIRVLLKTPTDFSVITPLLRCFGLFVPEVSSKEPRGMLDGMLRFTLRGHQVFLITSNSKLFKEDGKEFKYIDENTWRELSLLSPVPPQVEVETPAKVESPVAAATNAPPAAPAPVGSTAAPPPPAPAPTVAPTHAADAPEVPVAATTAQPIAKAAEPV